MSAGALSGRPRSARHRKQPARPGRRARAAARIAVCAALAGLAVVVLMDSYRVRMFEAWLASHVIALGTSTHTGHEAGALVWFATTPADQVALVITPECTIAFLTVPFLLATAWLVWARVPPLWPVAGLSVALTMLVVINQFRLLTIAWLVLAMGFKSGFYWGHTLLGSLITVLGVAASLTVYAILAVRIGNAARTR